ncbi:unnamed protein product [Victoria cruziana]
MASSRLEAKETERRERKRPRPPWDVLPSPSQARREAEGVTRLAEHGERGRVDCRLAVADVGSSRASPPMRDDDREGHYVFDLGENLTPRYKILSKIGEGTFGRVLECWDRETQEYVAIKVVRSIRKYRDAAMVEIDVLNQLTRNDIGGLRCVQIRNWFDYRNHICIVCEKLGPSLFDFLRRNKYSPFPVDLVREFGRQLLESVAYIHDLHLIHTDLKPENILLMSSEYVKLPCRKRNSQGDMHFKYLPKSSAIKLIDFGSTTFENEAHSSVVSTRHYRAPEVILGLGWTYPCDIWSVGCILVELCSGETLFQTHENLEHLAMMERVLGPLPVQMVRRASQCAEKYFRRGARLNWPEGAVSRESIRAVRKLDRLKVNFISPQRQGVISPWSNFKPIKKLI